MIQDYVTATGFELTTTKFLNKHSNITPKRPYWLNASVSL